MARRHQRCRRRPQASSAGFDVFAKVIDDPLDVFRVQTNGQLAAAPMNNIVGMNATFTFGHVGDATRHTVPRPTR